MQLHTIGIDLGKTLFHLVGLNQRGEVVVRKKFSRKQLLHFTANLQVELIGMEACGGSHFLGRALREQGHEVRLMPAQYVKPYVKTNKSGLPPALYIFSRFQYFDLPLSASRVSLASLIGVATLGESDYGGSRGIAHHLILIG